MFVQYSFVHRRPSSPPSVERHPIEITPAMVLTAGVAFMAVTSVLYLLV